MTANTRKDHYPLRKPHQLSVGADFATRHLVCESELRPEQGHEFNKRYHVEGNGISQCITGRAAKFTD